MEEKEIEIMGVPLMAEGMKIVCLKSNYNNKFLRYRYEDVQTHGLLQFAVHQVMDPYAQFEVEKSNTYDGLVHLKSRYNNKYLVRWSPNHYWIIASANKEDENQSSWSCTLFKPMYLGDNNDDTQEMRLLHVQLDHYACLWRLHAPFDSCLFAGSKEIDKDSCDVFTFVNWESLFNLPKHVAFKGENGKYLGAFEHNGIPCLQFSYDNLEDPKVGHELFEAPDGTLCIKSSHVGKFWRIGDGDWIVVDANDPRGSSNTGAMFRAVVRDVNVIALLNMSKTWFCKRFTLNEKESFLNAATQNVDEFAILKMIDLGTGLSCV
ncbi:uncharacterized protein LOC110698881 [Chenopodium quinoa]|uniref:Agglutinin domain-containing protein n=1 Tax=Chenopodium quinoa TaxID=63459 RepID=A0A803LE40_CHEQI|nr:uncharacterized protein LOC110698881 [Chenopodium quinoa]